jgi:diaminohydroxyphosphoribosylaminopyrimidine deaminase/5-amino-6-(5-phosphoribosylamino)uracil reductase
MPWGHASSGHTKTYMENNTKPGMECQTSFVYSEKQVEWLQMCLSPERLTPYYAKARGNDWVAFHLYVRNAELSASLYGVIQALEVGLRNLVHTKMTDPFGTEEWWDKLPLHEAELTDIAAAKSSISSRIKQIRPGRIVAELSFGFWVKLFANSYEKQLWVPYISRRFPAKLSRKKLYDRLVNLKELRNRIAHHETLIKRNTDQDYQDLLETIGWISPTLRRWVEHNSDFPAVKAKRIPKQPDCDTIWMQRALELARRGIGVTSPNPAVGCLILDCAGQVAGEGWHEYDLLDHAEVAALKVAQQHAPLSGALERLRGGTAYVTLEPCNHTGRTGPCTEALIAAGIKRVVAATIDPNPAVAGHGLERLRSAGIETAVGVCEAEARRLNEGFARWSQQKRPLVLMKVAMTLDGRIAPPPGVHTQHAPYWITSEEARAAVQPLRHQADAALTGVDTVLADDPLLTDRSGLRRRRPLLRVVLDSALRMPLEAKMVASAQNDVVVFTVSADEARAEALRQRGVRVEVLAAEAGRVPLEKVLDKLGEEGILTLLTETGTRLNTALLAGGLVDRVHLFVSPQIMGSDAVPAFKGLAGAIRMAEVEVERYGNDLGLCSLLRDPWPE